MDENVRDIIARFEQLQSQRSLWNDTWEDIIDYCLPHHPSVYQQEQGNYQGDVKHEETYDSTSNKAALYLASVINSMLTNQSSEWFLVETDNEAANQETEVKAWLEEVTRIIREEIDNSNFYTEINPFYIDLCTIGTAVLYIAESEKPDKTLYFSTRHISEIFIQENDEGYVDTVYRYFKMTARNLRNRFGEDALSEQTLQLLEKPDTMDELVEVLHCVMPREDYDKDKKGSKNMPFASFWIEKEVGHTLKESGYNDFPYIVARWLKSSGEMYGRSPAWSALPDIKTLNEMMKTMLQVAQKVAEPPLQVPSDMEDVDLTPGAMNFYDPYTQSQIVPIVIGANYPITKQMVEDYKANIRETFYQSQLSLIDKNYMTAEEVQTRTEENMRILAPTFGRLQTEFMDKMMKRILGILGENRKLPFAPDVIADSEFKLRYVSPLAKAQRQNEIQTINYTIATAKSMAEADPTVLDYVNWDNSLKKLSYISGTPIGILRDDKAVKQIREARQKAQEEQRQIEMQMLQAELAEKQSKAQKNTAKAQKDVTSE